MLQKKKYLTPRCRIILAEEQDIVTFSDGVSFNAQGYGWWSEGGTFE